MSLAIQLLGTDWCHGNNLSQLGNAAAAAAAAAVAVAGDGVAGGGVVAGDDDDDRGTPVHEPGAAAAVAVAAGVVVAAADVEGYVQVDLFFFIHLVHILGLKLLIFQLDGNLPIF